MLQTKEQIKAQFEALLSEIPYSALESEYSEGKYQRVNDAALSLMIEAGVVPDYWRISYFPEAGVNAENVKLYIRNVESGAKYMLSEVV